MRTDLTPFEILLSSAANASNVSVVVLLAWISTSDGILTDDELAAIATSANTEGAAERLGDIYRCLPTMSTRDFQIACEHVKEMSPHRKRLFIEMAIGVSIADGRLSIAENHILRFLADLVGMDAEQFRAMFVRMTNRPFPVPGDPSTSAWWHSRETNQNQGESRESNGDAQDAMADESEMTAARARIILGVPAGASHDDLKSAFRRLVSLHHPDRFTSLGEEAVLSATRIFKRIKSAYDILVSA